MRFDYYLYIYMITNHPGCPKKEIEKYYLQSKLPEYWVINLRY